MDLLRRSHETFYNLVHNNPFGVYVVDADFRLREVSRGAQKVFSNVKPLLGRDFAEILHSIWGEPFASETIARFRHTLDTGEPYAAERTVEKRRDIPDTEAYDWRIERITLPDGRFGVVCYFYDLSERQRWEAALRDSDARQSAALAVADLGTFEWNLRTNAVTLDRRSADIFGFPGEGPVHADDVFGRIDPDDVPRVLEAARASQHGKSRLEIEYRIMLPDSTRRDVLSFSNVILGPDGAAERMFGVFSDITERKRVERRDRLLLALDDAVRPLADPMQITATCARLLGEYLRADRCAYADVEADQDTFNLSGDYNRGVPSIVGRYRFTDFGQEVLHLMRENRAYVVEDIDTHQPPVGDFTYYRRTLIRAVICVPLHKGGRFVAAMAVHQKTPRRWTADEIEIVRHVAARCWESIERARVERSLRESAQRHQIAQNAARLGTWELDLLTGEAIWSEGIWILLGRTPIEGKVSWDMWNAVLHPDDLDRAMQEFNEQMNSGKGEFYLEFRINTADRGVRWIACKGRFDADENGKPIRALGANLDITERKEAELRFRDIANRFERQSRLFNQIAATTPDFIYVFDLQGRFLYANRRLLEVWGRTVENAVGKNLYELGYPAWHADMHMRELRHVIETKQPIKGEVPFTGASGISGVYEYIFTPVLGPDGNVEVIAGTTRDVTDRKHNREELETAKAAAEAGLARWRAVVESMDEGVVVADAAGDLPEWNAAALEMHGYATVEQARRHLNAFPDVLALQSLEGRDLPLEEWPMSRVLRGETFSSFEVTIRRLDIPHSRIISYSGKPVLDKNGRVQLAVLTLHDVTKEREAEAALRASERQMRLLTDALPALIGYVDGDLRYRFNNRAYFDWFGKRPDELYGLHLRDVLGETDYQQRMPQVEAALRGQTVRFEGTSRHRQRGPVDCELLYVPDIGEDGRVRGFVVLVQDITARKTAEAERERLLAAERAARAEAERASEAKSEFLATLSHELRTPLTPVLLTVSLMESHPALPPDLRADVATVRRNVELESRRISDLLDLTRIAKGKLQLEMQQSDLHLIVRSAVDICQREASARLTVNLEARHHVVFGDATRLQQIFWNLINNAIKFTPENGRISVRSYDGPDNTVQVEVSDTGAGIDPSVLPRLFNAFEQGEIRAVRQQAGLGLGLAISRKLAEAHGGTITASSAGRGQGSTFTVSLPAETGFVRHAPVTVPAEPAGAPQTRLNVLLVEDHEPTLRVMERLLRKSGHTVTGVTSVASAIAAARQGPFDLIISDLGLPDGSGLDIMRELREHYTGRAIALTGYGMESDVSASREAGFAEHLTKPVDLVTLQASIGRIVAGWANGPR